MEILKQTQIEVLETKTQGRKIKKKKKQWKNITNSHDKTEEEYYR